jgi:hypothetical protein
MEGIAEKFIEQLPAPLFGAIAAICLAAWILKEVKDFTRFGQVLSLKSFQLTCAVIFLTMLSYYGYVGFHFFFPSAEFDRIERGISVFGIERDDSGAAQAEIYESIKLALDTRQFPSDLRVKRSSKRFDDTNEDVSKYCRQINATVCTWGSLIPPSTVFMNVVRSSDPEAPARTQLQDYHQPADFVRQLITWASSSLPAGTGTSNVAPYVQDKIKSLEESQGLLADRLLSLEQRLAALETPSGDKSIAATETERRRLGLFVGIGNYTKMARIQFSSSDAGSMYQTARAVWKNNDFSLVQDAKRSDILGAMQKLSAKMNPDDQVWIYLSGHTVIENGEAYFLPVDADPNNVLASGVPFSQIRAWFLNLGAKQGVAFIDSCYSGAFISSYPWVWLSQRNGFQVQDR